MTRWHFGAGLLAAGMLVAAAPAWADADADPGFTVTLDSGRDVAVRLRADAPSDAPQPAIILLGGFQRGAGAIDLVQTDLPVLWVGMDYPYDPPRKFIFPGSLKHLPAFSTAVDETLEALRRVVTRLRERADVDAQRISIIGASAGTPFATIAAAQADIPGVVIVQGFGDLPEVIAHQFILRWQPEYGDWVVWPARALAHVLVWGLDLPHPEVFARRYTADQQVLFVQATDDKRIPARATQALWDAVGSSPAKASRTAMDGGHLGGDDTQALVNEMLRIGIDWMRTADLLADSQP